ncbi:hypothetical protein SAMN05446935_9821 [Burkholderia sp. YR290]|jgi:hypothetical protein|nr:hypothetical protein SAMN05446934_4963 [Paraburkholderia hospita]SOE90519.1 hypothetical protein SAMN05446935_9821 [Burkholderia sp. YR290]
MTLIEFSPAKSLSYDAVVSTTHASAQEGDIEVGYQF